MPKFQISGFQEETGPRAGNGFEVTCCLPLGKNVQSSEGWGMLCFENASRKVSFQGGFVKQCDTETHAHASRKWNEVLFGTSSGTSFAKPLAYASYIFSFMEKGRL